MLSFVRPSLAETRAPSSNHISHFKAKLIYLDQIWKTYGKGRKAKNVLCGLSAELDFSLGNIGILGLKKSGKTSIIHLIAGSSVPNSGKIHREVRVSWPMNWRGFGGDMPGDAQVSFLAKIYQADRRQMLRFVTDLSNLGKKIYDPVKTYSPKEKDRLFYAAALALDLDVYLIDEALPTIEKELADNYQCLWQERMRSSRFLKCTSQPGLLAHDCTQVAILEKGLLSSWMPAPEATKKFQRMIKKPKAAAK